MSTKQAVGTGGDAVVQVVAESVVPAPFVRQLIVGFLSLFGLSLFSIYLLLFADDYFAMIAIMCCFVLPVLGWLDNTRGDWLGTGGRAGIWFGFVGGMVLAILALRAVSAGVAFDVTSTVRNAPYQTKPYLISFSDGEVRQDLAGRFTGITTEVTVAPVVPAGWTPEQPVPLWVTGKKGRLPADLAQRWQQGERGGVLYSTTHDTRRSQAQLAIENAIKYHGLLAAPSAEYAAVRTVPHGVAKPNLQRVVILEWQLAPLKLGKQRVVIFWIACGLQLALWFGLTVYMRNNSARFSASGNEALANKLT